MKAHLLAFARNADHRENPTNGMIGAPERFVRPKVQVIAAVTGRQLPQLDSGLHLDVHRGIVRPQFGPWIHELHVRLLEIHSGRPTVEEATSGGDRL